MQLRVSYSAGSRQATRPAPSPTSMAPPSTSTRRLATTAAAERKPGDTLKLKVRRGSDELELEI